MDDLERRLRKAERELARADPVMQRQVERCGPCRIHEYTRRQALPALVSAIIAQQISVAAANTIERRFKRLLGGRISGRRILEQSDEDLRSAGISPQKAGYLRDLAEKVNRRQLSLGALESMPDEAAIAALTDVRGIGRWTAEIFLIFRLGRLDLLPVDDIGLQDGARILYELPDRADPDKLRELAEPWRPWRSVGAWYVWQGRRAAADLPLR